MLYDVFISHAGEDKLDFVTPLAKLLRERRVEVWFDEFTLTVGKSLRQSIDAGLTKSRFGIVVLSPSFFGKSWPEWELNGLVQRQLAGTDNVILPIWHKITHREVAKYSPSLANIVALSSDLGLEEVASGLLKVIRPETSALAVARDVLIRYGFQPPVISDDWWLDVIEGAGSQNYHRWCLPIGRMTNTNSSRGEGLAWTVMQHLWQEGVEDQPISQMTPPAELAKFIENQPGLLEVALAMPETLIEHAPQLSIKGFGGRLEDAIQIAYERSACNHMARRAHNDRSGSALTTDGLCPMCDERFALRHPTFGNYEPAMVACGFVQGHGAGLGPAVSAFEKIDYLIWLLSRDSTWLPANHRAYLLEGMKQWAVWPWSRYEQPNYSCEYAGKLRDFLLEAAEKKRSKSFQLSHEALADLHDRIEYSRTLLGLPESTDELVSAFLKERIPQSWFTFQDGKQRRKALRSRGFAL